MADLERITLPSGTTYDFSDATARADIEALRNSLTGGVSLVGQTTTKLTDGATTNPIIINGNEYTAKKGDLVWYNQSEFVFDGTKWIDLGDISALGGLAFKDSASGNFVPAGSVTISKGDGAANYTPEGSVAVVPSVTLEKTTINSITDVGSLPSCTMPTLTANVVEKTLILGWTDGTFNEGTLPTKSEDIEVATDVESATAVGTFTGTGAELTASFVGTSGSVTVE